MRKNPYTNIRPEDSLNLKTTSRILKSHNLEVFLTGSSLETLSYNDIDLLITPRQKYPSGFPKSISLKELQEIVESLKKEGAEILSKKLDEGTYAYSEIKARYNFKINGTRIDLSYSESPFTLNQSAERVGL